ncbi:uncharacterized protein LOC127789575 isoform X2 [Diospyros lotus]|uniref:uncharacterized protein LOC127789575 isoform X2 n=1 Tax=Diospyros lotus TaxID=55363 RepID=UPI002255DE23|nr:uncharacterized protein LOC127789575 isoform X2 [Diospyros lotus]
MDRSASIPPWILVIEALASFDQVDASILIDLVKRAPEISGDLGKNAREMVSLRILESLAAQRNGSTNAGASRADSKIEFDQAESCEDVVRRLVREIPASNLEMDSPEMLKWDIQSFVLRKRACLPKCTLLQLKEAILKGDNPILASLKDKSGLSISNKPARADVNSVTGRREGTCSDDQMMAAGGNLASPAPDSDGHMQEDSPNRNLLRSKTDLNTEDLAGKREEDHISMENGCDPHFHNSKKLKRDTSFTGQDIGQKSVPLILNELSEDLLGKNGQHTVREWSGSATSIQIGVLDENRCSEDGRDQHIEASQIPGQGDDAGLQQNLPSISCDNNVVTYKDLPIDESQCGSKHCAELETLNTVPANGTHQNNCDYTENNTTNQAKDDAVHNPGEEISSDSDGFQDEKIDIAMKKHTFLSSQCTFSQDSFTPADCSELNLCMKCNNSGKLLVCSASACPIAVHESCLGSVPSFDDCGNFYCPFCAYSRAISEYIESKKKTSLTRKDLSAFFASDNHYQENKPPNKYTRPEQSQLKQDDIVGRKHDTNYKKTYANKFRKYKHWVGRKQKRKTKSSASHGEEGVPVNTTFPAILEGNTKGENVGLNCQSAPAFEGQPIVSCGEGVPVNTTFPVFLEHSTEGKDVGLNCQSVTAFEGQPIVEQTTCELGDNSSCRDIGIVDVTETPVKDGVQQEVLLQPITDPPSRATSQPNIGMVESSEEENDQMASHYCIRFRKQEKQYTYPLIPMLRRKKLPWTAEEVEMLQISKRQGCQWSLDSRRSFHAPATYARGSLADKQVMHEPQLRLTLANCILSLGYLEAGTACAHHFYQGQPE